MYKILLLLGFFVFSQSFNVETVMAGKVEDELKKENETLKKENETLIVKHKTLKAEIVALTKAKAENQKTIKEYKVKVYSYSKVLLEKQKVLSKKDKKIKELLNNPPPNQQAQKEIKELNEINKKLAKNAIKHTKELKKNKQFHKKQLKKYKANLIKEFTKDSDMNSSKIKINKNLADMEKMLKKLNKLFTQTLQLSDTKALKKKINNVK